MRNQSGDGSAPFNFSLTDGFSCEASLAVDEGSFSLVGAKSASARRAACAGVGVISSLRSSRAALVEVDESEVRSVVRVAVGPPPGWPSPAIDVGKLAP